MKLLIVEGNPKEISQQRTDVGLIPHNQRFKKMLNYLEYTGDIEVAYPADNNSQLPNISNIKTYQGILLTGSSLHAYNNTRDVTRQLEFADTLFASGVPIYGSCWGLQIATIVAGGVVVSSPNGNEFGISEVIKLNQKGKNSIYFKDKANCFNAYCIHKDEVATIAPNTEVLASNSHSKVQAVTIHYKKSIFFGVQYHPEFIDTDILLRIDDTVQAEEIQNQRKVLAKILPQSIQNYKIHTLEISNWLNSLN